MRDSVTLDKTAVKMIGIRSVTISRISVRGYARVVSMPKVIPMAKAMAKPMAKPMMNTMQNTRWYGIKVEASEGEVPLVEPYKVLNKQEDKGLKIAERAAKRLNEIYKESQEVLRVLVESGGCHGFQYNMKLVPESTLSLEETGNSESKTQEEVVDEFAEGADSSSKDVIYIVSEEGGKVAIDETSLGILNNTTLNYTTELIGSTFKITDGNLKSSCGCGSSFDIEK